MKIGIVCYPTFGGSGVIATELGKALAEKGHEIHFVAYRQPFRLDSFSENITFHEVSLADYPLFDFLPYETALTSKMVSVAIDKKLDLFHVHYAIPHASTAYMAKQILAASGHDIKVITTLHGTDITLVGKDASYEPVVTFAINQSDGITAVSESLKEETYRNFKITKQIDVIPNFIDLDRFSKKPKEHFRKAIAPNGEKLIVHTSNFRKVKRVEDVLRVFMKIHEKIPSKLLLIGDGPDRSTLEKMAHESGMSEDIRFLGKLEAVEEILSVSDLFLLTSETESFGLASLEAMACQVPVISTNTGGSPEVNINGKTGFTSAVGDYEEMAKHAIHILSDEHRLAKFKANALQQAHQFDIQTILPLYEQLYTDILQGRK
jgi:N-acetyl-alpha-D-glucosaminyl L-malate synthase BshA